MFQNDAGGYIILRTIFVFFCITLLIGTGVGRFQGKVLKTPPLQKFELD